VRKAPFKLSSTGNQISAVAIIYCNVRAGHRWGGGGAAAAGVHTYDFRVMIFLKY